jgi:PAS domain S-box-containing protein
MLAELGAIVWRADSRTLRILDVSGSAEALVGYPEHTWLEPEFWPQRLVADERAEVLDCLRRASSGAGGEGDSIVHGFVDAGGRVRRFRSRARLVAAGGEEPEIVVLMVETPQADEPPTRPELAAMALEDASVLLVTTDAVGRIEVFSGACERLTGVTEAAIRGRPFWEFITYDDERSRLQSRFAHGADTITDRFVAHWADESGQPRVILWARRVITTSTGTIVRVVFTGVDLTERERVEETLRETGARHELLLEQLPAILWATDCSLHFTSGTGAALAGLGLRPGQLEGVSLFTFFGTDRPDDPVIEPSLRARAGETVSYQAEWLGRMFDVVSKPLRDPGGDIIGTIGLALDVTDRVAAERERDRLFAAERAAREEAERALELRDEFLSIASHELATPVTTLLLAVDALVAKEVNGIAADRLLATASKQTHRVTKLINELLDVSRIRAGTLDLELTEMDLSATAREVAARLEPLAQRAGCELEVEAQTPIIGSWDRSRIEQIVSNLIGNAIRHAPGARITMRTENCDGEAMLEVADRGPGIPPDRLPHIFERFERATSARHHGGLGLGLYIVRELAEAHGGHVTVESQLGAGATFRVYLGRQAGDAERPAGGLAGAQGGP